MQWLIHVQYQDQVQSALWGRGSVNLFTAAVTEASQKLYYFALTIKTRTSLQTVSF